MIGFVYNLVLNFLFLFGWPFLLKRMGRREFITRLGIVPPRLREPIWVHAASVGEVNAVKPFLAVLREQYPGHPLLITVMTPAGLETARQIQPPIESAILPMDLAYLIRRWFIRIRPRALILMETELWPNLLRIAGESAVPIAMVSARLSERSLRRFSALGWFWKPLFSSIIAVGAQSEADAARFRKLGFRDVRCTGNLKFDLSLPSFDRETIRREWGLAPNDFVVTLGSSRPGEEDMLADACRKLAGRIPNLRWIVAPRHLNRLDEVKLAFSGLSWRDAEQPGSGDVLLITRMGQLARAYAMSDLAVVGGSFADFGGHNPLEPAFYGLPILMGPHYRSCRDSVTALQAHEAIRIESADSFSNAVMRLYEHPEIREQMSASAKKTLQDNAGAIIKSLLLTKPIL
jgi:3-deoxy-D-manno-octulosonic-acid transferase